MIPNANIIEWQSVAPWPNTQLVEHDLILSKAICVLYQNPLIRENLVFRGGTALHKLFFKRSGRFSEDLDFVQIKAEPIGETVQAVRECLDDWLGEPRRKQSEGRFTLSYHFETEAKPVVKRKVKIEINTREHFNVQPLISKPFVVENSWFNGIADVFTYSLDELLGTKLRALYQRKKGRDLYDFWYVVKYSESAINYQSIVEIFQRYIDYARQSISRAEFERNIIAKQSDAVFNNDILPLLTAEYAKTYEQQQAYRIVMNDFIARLPGEPWKGSE